MAAPPPVATFRLPDAQPGLTRAYVGLGANLGDAQATLASAFAALACLPGTALVGRSALYASAPVDAAGPDFTNAVAALDTPLAPPALLAALHAIEATHGRQRSHRNAPRTLDLDLLAHGSSTLDTPTLTLPHRRLHLRAFVLVPLLALVPDLALPGLGPLAPYLSPLRGQVLIRLPGPA